MFFVCFANFPATALEFFLTNHLSLYKLICPQFAFPDESSNFRIIKSQEGEGDSGHLGLLFWG